MPHPCIQTSHQEHASISSILTSILAMLQRGPRDDEENFFETLRAMLFYLDEFPARQHHPKETEFLFRPLSGKSEALAQVIHKLELQHVREETAIRDLQHRLLAWEYFGEARRRDFEEEARNYIQFYHEHMRLEETVVIPEARKLLSDAEWKVLDDAFASNSHPLAPTVQDEPAFRKLFTRIVMTAPDPIGLGHGRGAGHGQ